MSAMLTQLPEQPCHGCPVEETAAEFVTDLERGLTSADAADRLARFGPNRVTPRKKTGPLMRFLLQFHQPLIYILIGAGAVTAALGEWVDSSVIFGVVLVNAVVGFIQESRAESAIESLMTMMTTQAVVLRDGSPHTVPSADLVPGDIVLLQSGDKVPADLRLFVSRELQVDESALTGESVPVAKHVDVMPTDTVLADRGNMAYAGTLVTFGQGRGIVVATGDRTETGRISGLIAAAVEISTPLTRKIAHFSRVLLVVILAVSAAMFFAGWFVGHTALEMFMAAVALAVSAIPEGLPAAVTITLAIGVKRMADVHAIIRKLPAVETLGSTTVICSDKTGTLTENQMTVQKISAGGELYEITGSGYAPEGEILAGGAPADPDSSPALAECLRAGLLCNDSRLVQQEGRWGIEGDPTEGALLVSAAKAGLQPGTGGAWTRIDVIPFESERAYMATLHDPGEGRAPVAYVKGAVEKVLEQSTQALARDGSADALDRDSVLQAAEAMASEGLRVLAFARKELPAAQRAFESADGIAGLTFLGLQGMIDPPRQEAMKAIETCRTAGVEVKMITGDHAVTAAAIAAQLGLTDPAAGNGRDVAVTGRELQALSDAELIDVAGRARVFARVAPEQKLRLVEALQARGHVVAMTGDGVNDAPALKQADIGIAMGITGTEVAKEAADMVLTDDNFATIEAAVEEGRRIFDNLTKFFVWTLPTNGGEALVIITSVLAGTGVALPVLPVQILWINMTTAVLLGLMLAFETKESDVMFRPPRVPDSPILTGVLIQRIILVSVLMLLGVFALFLLKKQSGAGLAEARTVAVNVIVMIELFYLFNCRSLRHSMRSLGFFSNPWVLGGSAATVALQLFYTYHPWMNTLFHSAPLALADWAAVVAVSLAVSLAVGGEKWLRERATPAAASLAGGERSRS